MSPPLPLLQGLCPITSHPHSCPTSVTSAHESTPSPVTLPVATNRLPPPQPYKSSSTPPPGLTMPPKPLILLSPSPKHLLPSIEHRRLPHLAVSCHPSSPHLEDAKMEALSSPTPPWPLDASHQAPEHHSGDSLATPPPRAVAKLPSVTTTLASSFLSHRIKHECLRLHCAKGHGDGPPWTHRPVPFSRSTDPWTWSTGFPSEKQFLLILYSTPFYR
jgi:hypothetical protein